MLSVVGNAIANCTFVQLWPALGYSYISSTWGYNLVQNVLADINCTKKLAVYKRSRHRVVREVFVSEKGLFLFPCMVGKLRRGRYVHGMIKLAQVMEQQNSSFHQFKYGFSAGLVVQYRYTLKCAMDTSLFLRILMIFSHVV